MPFTRFMDMHSGGGTKIAPYEYILIEAPEDEAINVFYNRFGRNPNRVTCTCCGNDYSIDEEETLELLTAYDRGCDFGTDSYLLSKPRYDDRPVVPLSDYLKRPDVLFIPASEIKPEERGGCVPVEGYVWS